MGTSWPFRKCMALDLSGHLWRHNALMKMTHFCPREKTWNLQNISSKALTSQACLLKGFRNNYTIPFANCHVLYVNTYFYGFSSKKISGIPENVNSISYMIFSLNDLEIAFEGQNKIANSGKQLHHHIESKLLSFS